MISAATPPGSTRRGRRHAPRVARVASLAMIDRASEGVGEGPGEGMGHRGGRREGSCLRHALVFSAIPRHLVAFHGIQRHPIPPGSVQYHLITCRRRRVTRGCHVPRVRLNSSIDRCSGERRPRLGGRAETEDHARRQATGQFPRVSS